MQRKRFGRIVAALRKEQFDITSGRSWSQKQLAIETGLTENIVGKIERGQQSQLDKDSLQNIAQAFSLTVGERREFFGVAGVVTDVLSTRPKPDADVAWVQVRTLLDSLYAPAMCCNPFADIIGINRAMLAFQNISLAQIRAAQATATRVNVLDLLLNPDAPLRQALGQGWRTIVRSTLQDWRTTTLCYRHTTRFQELFTTLSSYPDFRVFWVDSKGKNDSDQKTDLCKRVYTHKVYGAVGYSVVTDIRPITFGCLTLSIFVPHDSTTAGLFSELAGTNKRSFLLSH